MATNVSERIHTLQDVLDALDEQASAATTTTDFDPSEDMGEAFYLAGQLMAIAQATAVIRAMIDDLWATNTGGDTKGHTA